MPLAMTARTRPPMIASSGRPLPPNRLVPPMTAAPTASSKHVAAALALVDRLGARGEQQAGDRGHGRVDDEDRDPDPVDRDTGPAGGLGVAADGVDVPAVAGAGQDEGQHDEEAERQRHDPRHAFERRHRDLDDLAALTLTNWRLAGVERPVAG